MKLVINGKSVGANCDQNCQFVNLNGGKIRVLLLGTMEIKEVSNRDIVGFTFEDGNSEYTLFIKETDRIPPHLRKKLYQVNWKTKEGGFPRVTFVEARSQPQAYKLIKDRKDPLEGSIETVELPGILEKA